jgi:hypothetical protein
MPVVGTQSRAAHTPARVSLPASIPSARAIAGPPTLMPFEMCASPGAVCEWLQSLASQLMEDIAAEDPRSGDLVVQLIDSPYVLPGDRAEAESWAI